MASLYSEEMEIFPNLPDDIGRLCLLRVSFKFHNNLKAVCKRWRDELNSRRFYQDRTRLHLCNEELLIISFYEELSYGMIVYDPLDNWMRRIPPIPAEFDLNFTAATVCASVPNKLVLLGFRKDKILTGQVCIFDFGSAKWYRGKDMPPCSYAFRCRVKPDRGLIFAAGGYSKYNRFKPYTAVYRVEEDRWIKPVPEISKEHFDGWASIDGKNFELRVFEGKASIWIPGEARPWWPGLYECECPCVAAFGRFYLFDSEGVNVILGPQEKGKEKERCVVEQFQFPHKLLAVDFAQLCGDYIYVVAVESEHRLWVSYLFRPLSQNHTWSVSEPPQDRYFNICSVKI